MGTSSLLLILSIALIISFFYNNIQRRFNISAVILLLISGVALQFVVRRYFGNVELPPSMLPIFGTLGLLIIVLEAVLDMDINRENYRLYIKAAAIATVIVCGSCLVIAYGFMRAYSFLSPVAAIVYALPLSIVSSAIVIPSLKNLTSEFRDLIILESVFSDIIGILLFNFFVMAEFNSVSSIGLFGINFALMVVISLVTTIILGIVLSNLHGKNQHVFILAILIFVYTVAKHFHLSSLILILVFGLFLRNLPQLMSTKIGVRWFGKFLNPENIRTNLTKMNEFVDEIGFIIRTFFFILLGYSINLAALGDLRVILLGVMIAIAIYAVRWLVFLPFPKAKDRLLGIAAAPRGLITVLLFFQLPDKFSSKYFDGGVVFFVVIITSVVMSYALVHNKYKKD